MKWTIEQLNQFHKALSRMGDALIDADIIAQEHDMKTWGMNLKCLLRDYNRLLNAVADCEELKNRESDNFDE